MPDYNIVIAGFGGQGVLLMGKLLAICGLTDGKEVSWIPSYGPEMRGGTANCTVRICDHPIGSPVVGNPNCVIAMNIPSFDKFESTVEKGGFLIYNSSLIEKNSQRKDIHVIAVPANDLASERFQNPKLMNMILFGTYLKHSGFVNFDTVMKALEYVVSKKHAHMLPINKQAIELGMTF